MWVQVVVVEQPTGLDSVSVVAGIGEIGQQFIARVSGGVAESFALNSLSRPATDVFVIVPGSLGVVNRQLGIELLMIPLNRIGKRGVGASGEIIISILNRVQPAK
jgi:hypothetical protein